MNVTLKKYDSDDTTKSFGSFDTPLDGTTGVTGAIPVTGWVLDDIGLSTVKIYRDKVATQTSADAGDLVYIGDAMFVEGARRDVEQSYPGYPENYQAGWALTPMPNKIPEDGSTIYVWVDGQRLGHPDYNQYRDDIAMLFPGYANSDGAIGAFYLNTTVYENGVHTIAWSVEDNAGNSDGIGSRFFTIANTGGDAQVKVQAVGADNNPSVSFKSILYMPVNFERIKYQRGYGKDGVADFMEPDPYGTAEIEIREVERVEFVLGGGVLGSYTVIEDQLRPLPIGSTLDKEKGIFYWQPGPGFLGEYDLVFIKSDEFGLQKAINVRIKIRPKFGVTLK